MWAHGSLLFCLFLGIITRSTTISASSCPSDYFDGKDGSCYFVSSNAATRNDAYNQCAEKGAYLVDSNSAAQNEQIRNWSYKFNKIWIGLICTSNNPMSCVWDATKLAITNSSYTNFAQESPKASVESCASLNVLTGQWESNDCTVTYLSYMCKFTPTIEAFITPLASTTSASGICGSKSSYENNGTIYSPGYPSGMNNASCTYRISVNGSDNYVQIYFSDIGIYAGSKLEFSTCSSCPPFKTLTYQYDKTTVYSPSNVVFMNFTSKYNDTSYWIANYSPYTSQCQAPMNYTGSGTIFSPNNTYSGNCEYLITVEQTQVLQINFTTLTLQLGDQLAFYSDLYSSTPFKIIYKISKSSNISIISPSNMIRMVYNATYDSSSTWTAIYGPTNRYEKCPIGVPYNYTGNGTVSSPNYSIGSIINNNCEYIIKSGSANLSAQIYLSYYFYQNSSLKIYGDSSSAGSLLQTFNSTTNYYKFYTIVSPTDTLRLVYNTQADGSYWRGTYSTTPICNSQNFNSGNISSPNYPKSYPNDADRNCTYSLDSKQNVTCISFDLIDISRDTYIHVFDGPAWGKEIVTYNYTTSLNSYTTNNASLKMCTQINRAMTVVFQMSHNYNNNNNIGFIARFAGSLDDLKNLDVTTTTARTKTIADGNSAISLLILFVYNYL